MWLNCFTAGVVLNGSVAYTISVLFMSYVYVKALVASPL
jgi:hypothetical protein